MLSILATFLLYIVQHHPLHTKCDTDSHTLEFVFLLWMWFFCTDWSSFYFPLTEWKAPGSFCKPVQQYIKGEQSTHKWKNFKEWCTAFNRLQEIKVENMKGGSEGAEMRRQRLTGEMEWEQLIDNLTPASHRPNQLWPFDQPQERRGVFKPQLLGSEWSHILLSLSVCLSLSLLSLCSPSLPPGKVCITSDSGVSIIVLLSLLWDKPFTCDNRCQGHFISTTSNNVWSVSRMKVTAAAIFILNNINTVF